MQELFCRLCRIEDLSKINHLEAYARRAAVHLAYDWLRDRKRNPLSLSESGIDPVSPTLSVRPEIQDRLCQILDAAARLEGLTWDCFVMRYIEQMKHDEIAARLGKTPQQVRGLCSRAVRKIREMVTEKQRGSSYKEAAHG